MKRTYMLLASAIVWITAHASQELSEPFAAANAGNLVKYNHYKAVFGTLPRFMIGTVILAVKQGNGFHDIDVILAKEADAIGAKDVDSSLKALALYRKKHNLTDLGTDDYRGKIMPVCIVGYAHTQLEQFQQNKFGKQTT